MVPPTTVLLKSSSCATTRNLSRSSLHSVSFTSASMCFDCSRDGWRTTGPRAGSRPISWYLTITGPQRRNVLLETEIHDCRDGQQVRTHITEWVVQGYTLDVVYFLVTVGWFHHSICNHLVSCISYVVKSTNIGSSTPALQ